MVTWNFAKELSFIFLPFSRWLCKTSDSVFNNYRKRRKGSSRIGRESLNLQFYGADVNCRLMERKKKKINYNNNILIS